MSRADGVEDQVSFFEAKLSQSRSSNHDIIANLIRQVKNMGSDFVLCFWRTRDFHCVILMYANKSHSILVSYLIIITVQFWPGFC